VYAIHFRVLSPNFPQLVYRVNAHGVATGSTNVSAERVAAGLSPAVFPGEGRPQQHVTLPFLPMRLLDRYIAREVFRHALLGLLIFTFVLFVPQLVKLMGIFVRHSGSSSQVVILFLCIIPSVLVFTIPMAVLIGVLLGLGRMSMDSEIIALTSLGISRKRILVPVGVLAIAGGMLTFMMSAWLAPLALRTGRDIEAKLITSQISFAVQPRVFDERFPHLVLYVNDVAASGTHWNGVFIAEAGVDSNSQITLAESAIVIAEPNLGKLELHLNDGTTHEVARATPDHYSITAFGRTDWPMEFSTMIPPKERTISYPERPFRQLFHDNGPTWRDARVELNQRLAFPAACFVFALIAVPLGAQPRRGGRAAGSLLAIVIIASYYLILVTGAGLARQGLLPVFVGIWAANFVIVFIALGLFPRMERYRGEIRPPAFLNRLNAIWRLTRRRKARARTRSLSRTTNGDSYRPSYSSLPSILDLYVLRRFLYYFVMIMVAFIFLFEIFTFFELAEDIRRHNVPFMIVVNYFRFLIPYSVYQFTPLGALVSVLVTLGVMSKNNEIVAFKASGISLYRIALPILISGCVLASALLILDDTYLPYANQRQDALRAIIKGRPAQTYTRPQRWIFGENSKVYNYDLFDPKEKLFGGLSVIELDPATFEMRRRVFANRAEWLDNEKTWVLESGWVRDFSDGSVAHYTPFKVTSLPELTEPPSYFNREVIQAFQMSWPELNRYIVGLRTAGFDISSLTVQLHKKLAYPLIAPISMMLAIPFALFVGSRGAIGGLALGVGIGIGYWALSALTEAMGGIGQLPPFLAAWSPDLIFFFLALYFFFKMPT
jgi:LPS export ABC transporter permease LptF/LPS export ABC transporter permease LptG